MQLKVIYQQGCSVRHKILCAMALLALTILFVISVNAEYLSEDEKAVFLSTHNTLRSLVDNPSAANMLKVQWSVFLAEKANKWVTQCKKGNDRFINQDAGQWKRLGQNNWVGDIEQYQTYAAVPVFEWVQRGTDYSFKKRTCGNNVPQKECFDFTQVIMATTEFIGCAKNQCDNKIYVTCFYGPGGNSFFKTPYKAGEPCSKCPTEYTCEDKLCVPPSPAERGLLEDVLQFLQTD